MRSGGTDPSSPITRSSGNESLSAIASLTAITLKNILVATDLSPASLWSLPYVVDIAREYGSTIYLANVIPLEMYGLARPESIDAITAECRDYAQEQLERSSAGIGAQGIPVQTLLAEGDVGLVISDWVRQQEIDLLAVGTTGRSGLPKLFLGSKAEELIRDALCPVLTVGPALSCEPAACLRSVLLATDFSADSLHAAAYAFAMARHHRARLILLHVTADAAASRTSLLQRMSDLIPDDCGLVNVETLLAEGRPATKILEIASQHSAGLITLGVRGAGGFARATNHFGSNAHEVILGAACPVLTVRSQPG